MSDVPLLHPGNIVLQDVCLHVVDSAANDLKTQATQALTAALSRVPADYEGLVSSQKAEAIFNK